MRLFDVVAWLLVATVPSAAGCTFVGLVVGASIPSNRTVRVPSSLRPGESVMLELVDGRTANGIFVRKDDQAIYLTESERTSPDGDQLSGETETKTAPAGRNRAQIAVSHGLEHRYDQYDVRMIHIRQGSYVGTGALAGAFLDLMLVALATTAVVYGSHGD